MTFLRECHGGDRGQHWSGFPAPDSNVGPSSNPYAHLQSRQPLRDSNLAEHYGNLAHFAMTHGSQFFD